MNKPKLFAKACHDFTERVATKVLSVYINSMSWKTGDRVLDLGCGPGRVTTQMLMPRLPEDFGPLVGADLLANMIQYASETYTNSKLRFIQFDLSKDIENTLQLRPSDFGKIFCFFLLHCIPDQRYYLAIEPGVHSSYTFIVGCWTIYLWYLHTCLNTFRNFEGTWHLRNVGKYLPLWTALHPTRIQSSSIPLWELQISHHALSFEIILIGVGTICKM